MQSSMTVAGMDALSESFENILTRRANQRHFCIIAQFAKRPWPCPTTGSSARLQARNPYPQLKLHRLATAKGRPARCRAARACHARAPRRYRREPSSRPQHGNGTRPTRQTLPADWATGPQCGLLILQKRFYLLVPFLERHGAFESLAIDEEGRRRIDLQDLVGELLIGGVLVEQRLILCAGLDSLFAQPGLFADQLQGIF